MARGICIGKNGLTGGDFSVRGGIPVCTDPLAAAPADAKIPGGTAVTTALTDMKSKQIFTEESSPVKLDGILKLQKECLKADPGQSQALQHFVIEKGEKGTGILILTVPSRNIHHSTKLYPAHAALYSIAHEKGLIKPKTNTLVLLFSGSSILSVAVEGESTVFARSFPESDELAGAIRFSAQSVYFAKQRELLEINTVLVISPEKDDAEKVKKACSGGEKIEFLDISDYFNGSNLDKAGKADMLLAYGISLAPGIKTLDKWCFGKKDGTGWKRKTMLIRCAALLIAAGPLIYGADILSNKMLIAKLDRKAAAIAPIASRVSLTMSDVNVFKSFASNAGRKLIGPDICSEIFSALDKARGSDIYMTAIAGNPYSTISINGNAGSYSSLLDFMAHLASSKKVSASELIYANSTDSGSVEFQIILKYKFPMEFKGSKRDQEEQD